MDNAEKEKLFQLGCASYQKALNSMIEKSCQLDLKRLETTETSQLSNRIGDDQIAVRADFNGNLSGINIFIFPREILTLLPETGEDDESLALSALSELVSMMLGGFCAELKQQQIDLNYNAPTAEVLDKDKLNLPTADLQLVNYVLKSEEVEISCWQILEEAWVESIGKSQSRGNQTAIKGVEFPQFDVAHLNPQEQKNLGLLMDVPMVVAVELGRTRWQLRDVLTIGEGSIIELDKQAGEQVDILVNNNLVARGEVVVVDENFSVRITEIISTIEQMLQRIE